MNISGNNINTPVEFYGKNTGNNIGYIRDTEKNSKTTNVFEKKVDKSAEIPVSPKSLLKRKKYGKRLNTADSEYLSDIAISEARDEVENFFITTGDISVFKNLQKITGEFFEKVPLINYFILKKRGENIKESVENLESINVGINELINTEPAYGEEDELYEKLAENLSDAATAISKTNKKYNSR